MTDRTRPEASGDPSARSLKGASKLRVAAICLVLGLATLAVYFQTYQHEFIAYDDDQYVYQNPIVQAGLTASGLAWALGSFFYGNWHPLTWWSHMLDCQLFGLDAGAHHLVNLALHLASTSALVQRLASHDGAAVAERAGRRNLRPPSVARRIRGVDLGAKGRAEHAARDRHALAVRAVHGSSHAT